MRPYRILIVDDHRETRRMLRAGLETLPQEINIVDVPSGEEAILVNSRQPFDLLVVDVRLPGISGLELIEHAQIRNPNLKIILVTGLTDPIVREKVEIAEADAYFYKPIEINDFLNAVKKFLRQELKPDRKVKGKAAEVPNRASSAGISERLAGLRGRLDAHSALLVGERGDVLAQAGTLPAVLGTDQLLQTALAALTNMERISVLLGVASPNDLSIINGENYDLAFRHVGPSIGLLLVAETSTLMGKNVSYLSGAMSSAASDIFAILSDIGVPVEPVESEGLTKADEPPEEIESVAPAEDVERIFDLAKKAKTTNADAFWDSAVESGGIDEGLRSDTISYDQARQLGLAPEDS
jgi:CheY-like chemotaxis protein